MLTQAETAWLLLQLIQDTRTYRGVSFDIGLLDDAEKLRYAEGLFRVLPGWEKRAVEASFERIRNAAETMRTMRAMDYLATNPEPAVIQ